MRIQIDLTDEQVENLAGKGAEKGVVKLALTDLIDHGQVPTPEDEEGYSLTEQDREAIFYYLRLGQPVRPATDEEVKRFIEEEIEAGLNLARAQWSGVREQA